MTKPAPDHIDHTKLTCYKHRDCRRPACVQRSRDYESHRRRLQAYGRWQPFVDAGPVRQHVRMLMSYGIGLQRIARLAGVSNGGIGKLVYGDVKRSMAPSRRVRTATADRLLSVKATLDNAAPHAHIDGTGTLRRLQALVAVGWPISRLAARLGEEPGNCWRRLHRESGGVTAETARAVRNLYDELWNVAPAAAGVHPQYIARAKAIAARRGWPPPVAWDDDYIDSPAATPDVGDKSDRYVAIAEDAEWLMRTQGYTPEQTAHRLGITRTHLCQVLREVRGWQRSEAAA